MIHADGETRHHFDEFTTVEDSVEAVDGLLADCSNKLDLNFGSEEFDVPYFLIPKLSNGGVVIDSWVFLRHNYKL